MRKRQKDVPNTEQRDYVLTVTKGKDTLAHLNYTVVVTGIETPERFADAEALAGLSLRLSNAATLLKKEAGAGI